jgi:hypothetical protein
LHRAHIGGFVNVRPQRVVGVLVELQNSLVVKPKHGRRREGALTVVVALRAVYRNVHGVLLGVV